jgi:SAM-dependent methyltransferase
MRRPRFIAEQSRRPRGWLGWLIGSLMARETAAANDAVLDALALTETDRVLDVGCGHGRTVERAASAVPRGHVAGIDFSEEMLRLANRRCRSLVDEGRVELRCGDASALPYPSQTFDKVLSVHTLYFWPDAPAVVREIHRVLADGGRLVLGFHPKEDARFVADFPESVYRFHSVDDAKGLLFAAGFAGVTASVAAGRDGVTLVTATRGLVSPV